MVAYEFYSPDKIKGYELIGILPERRRNPKRITRNSVLRWGRMLLPINGNGKGILVQKVLINESTGKFFQVDLSSKAYKAS